MSLSKNNNKPSPNEFKKKDPTKPYHGIDGAIATYEIRNDSHILSKNRIEELLEMMRLQHNEINQQFEIFKTNYYEEEIELHCGRKQL